MHTLVRRFLPGWKIRAEGIEIFGTETVAIERYRYRGAASRPHGQVPPRRHEHAESRMRWKSHVRFGRRAAKTGRSRDRHRAAARPHTYLRTWEGFLYLAVVVDACTRRVVGWAMADHLRTELVLDAVGMALFARKPAPGLVHHSDRGCQYTSYEFGKTLRTSGLLASMGRVGSAFDNAMAESFFATLKAELVYRRAWPTRHALEMEVFSYIEGFYNPRRRHSRLDNLSPADFEKTLTTRNEASA